jgi:hypothetical protein
MARLAMQHCKRGAKRVGRQGAHSVALKQKKGMKERSMRKRRRRKR